MDFVRFAVITKYKGVERVNKSAAALRKHVALLMVVLLTVTLYQPAFAGASDKIELKSSSAPAASSRIDAKLSKQFDQGEYVTYLVKMKEQVDTQSVARNSLQQATLQKLTPSAVKMSVRSNVISSLRNTASRTQYELEQYLEQELEKGEVKEYKSYFIVNALAITSTKEVMENIAQLPEVEKLLPNETRYLDRAPQATAAKPVQAVDHATPAASKTDPVAVEAASATTKAEAVKDKASQGAASAVEQKSANEQGAAGALAPAKEAATDAAVQDGGKSAVTDKLPGGTVKHAVDPSTLWWNIKYVNAPEVWERGIDGTGIVVANLDSGVDYTHPALRSKWRGIDAQGNIVNPELSWYDPHSGSRLPQDTDGHGTHTMGTMVGSEPDGTNYIGVAPGAKWMAVRIFNPETTDAIILDGGQWLLAPVDAEGNLHPELAPDVVNNSWGGGAGMDEWFRPVVQAWRDAQIFPEFSAGNTRATNPGGPGSVANPANYPESFATGATDINGNLASFSLLGPSPYGEIKPEVSAPGVNIRSSVPGGGYENQDWDGTSMAGPHTTAIAALLLQANHSLTVDQLEQIIIDTAVPRTDSQYPQVPNNGYGHGIVNARDAVNSVLEGMGSVSGRVVTGGDDLEEPVLEHTPLEVVFKGTDALLTAKVTDNVSVLSVEGFVREAGSSHWLYLPFERISGNSTDGVYTASIPSFILNEGEIEYYLRVNDYGNNSVTSEVYTVTVSSGVKPGYTQDFETDRIGFTSGGTGNTWAWGEPVSGPGSAYSGSKVFASNLSGTYAAGANSFLLAPPIDLRDSAKGALVSFQHWYDFENNFDYGKVLVAAEENDFAFEPVLTFTGTSGDWRKQYVDLTPYAGQQVQLMFTLTSDNTTQKAGWYIDDFAVERLDDIAPGAPQDLRASVNFTGQVSLDWTAPQDEDVKEYTVFRATYEATDYAAIGTTTGLTFNDVITVTGSTYYTVAAKDYSGNVGERSNVAVVEYRLPEVIYSDNFDSGSDNGWTHGGTKDEWERGVPVAPGPVEAVSPPNVWGTDLDGTYESSANFWLASPVIDLTDREHATLSFSHWFEIEGGYDYGYVEISRNGGDTWSELGKFSHNTLGKKWTPVDYSLDAYTGEEVIVRFRLQSDGSVVKTGWYIDNFRIVDMALPSVAKTRDIVLELSSDKEKQEKNEVPYKITITGKEDFSTKTPVSTEGDKGEIGLESLPASATVTVVETGRSVKTDPATGRYTLHHTAGEYTLKAEAYGYYPQTRKVNITDGTETRATFNLEAIPQGTLEGVVTDERSGQPIVGARVVVLEDAAAPVVTTDQAGRFTLQLLEGNYTLSLAAQDYYADTVSVTVSGNDTEEVSIALKPFIGFPGEIAYDDGTPENARAFNAGGNAWAVRMTPASEHAQVTGAAIRFWNTEWPQPGGTAFQYAVYDASGEGGAPGRLLAGPFDATALRNNEWTRLELEEPVTVEGDFYIVYIQTPAGTAAPGLATDESSPNALRSWQRASGTWSLSPVEEGNYMIRALVRYPVNAPVIVTPATDTYTAEEALTVTGTSPADGAELQLFNGEELVGTTTVENQQFSLPITLQAGDNALSVQALVDGKLTDRSAPVHVILDQAAPVLEVTAPVDGTRTNAGDLRVTGTVHDDYLHTLTINGAEVQVEEDGSFSHRLLIEEGQNQITVTARDLAGNETSVTRTVHLEQALPEIRNVTPTEDVRITPGEALRVTFDSDPGLQASFRIEVPLVSSSARNEISFFEAAPGRYEAYYNTPNTLRLSGGVIVIRIRDAAGNEVEIETAGKLYVNPI